MRLPIAVCLCAWLLVATEAVPGGILHPGRPAATSTHHSRAAAHRVDEDDDLYAVPEGLLFGAGVSAGQSEGAWKEGGKSESIMDFLAHATPKPALLDVLDVSADHYHRYKEDLGYAQQMQLKSHRFSIAWGRIFPSGDASKPNEDGAKFYDDYINEVLAKGMEPMVTMYHFDHPYSVEVDTKGWTEEAMVDKFVEYADFLFKRYGSKVRYWNPINEGNMYCIYMLPRIAEVGLTPTDDTSYYKCIHNTIIAHARVYDMYRKTYYNETQGGMVGTSVLVWPAAPATAEYEDVMAANVMNDVFGGTPIHPLVFGDYPAVARYLVDKRSRDEFNMTTSRLPDFSEEDKKIMQSGPTTDFVALNVYGGFKVRYTHDLSDVGMRPFLIEPAIEDMPFVKVVAAMETLDGEFMKSALLWAWNAYHLPLIITENGSGDSKGVGVQDAERAAYLSANIRSMVRTMKEYDIPVLSFYAWSLIDVFEFSGGYDKNPYGLVRVDFKDSNLTRTLKDSSKLFVEMARTGRVPDLTQSTPSTPSSSSTTSPLALLAAVGVVAAFCQWKPPTATP